MGRVVDQIDPGRKIKNPRVSSIKCKEAGAVLGPILEAMFELIKHLLNRRRAQNFSPTLNATKSRSLRVL